MIRDIIVMLVITAVVMSLLAVTGRHYRENEQRDAATAIQSSDVFHDGSATARENNRPPRNEAPSSGFTPASYRANGANEFRATDYQPADELPFHPETQATATKLPHYRATNDTAPQQPSHPIEDPSPEHEQIPRADQGCVPSAEEDLNLVQALASHADPMLHGAVMRD